MSMLAVSGAPSRWIVGLILLALIGGFVATKAGVISDYERALKQRNSLLKSRAPQSSLSPWDEHLAVFGGEVIAGRLKLIAEIEPLFQTAYKNLSEKKVAKLGYKSSVVGADTDKEENKKKILSTMTEISAQE